MSDHIFSTAMPHALHPNCYLDVLFSDETFPSKKGNRYILRDWFERLADILLDEQKKDETEQEREERRVELEAKLVKLKKGIPDDFKFDNEIGILRRPIRFRQSELAHVLDRNTTFLLNRIQKEYNKGMLDKIRYKQTKRAVAMTLFSLLEAQLLLEREDDFQTPSGFKFSNKDKLVYDEFRKLITGELDITDTSDFPLLKDYANRPMILRLDERGFPPKGKDTEYYEAKDGVPWAIQLEGNGRTSFGYKFENLLEYLKNGRHGLVQKGFLEPKEQEVHDSLSQLDSVLGWKKWRPSALLKQNRFAYHQMITQDCQECGVKRGTPCKIGNLSEPFDKTLYYANGVKAPRILAKSWKQDNSKIFKHALTVLKMDGWGEETGDGRIQLIKKMKKDDLTKLFKALGRESAGKTKPEMLKELFPEWQLPIKQFLLHYYQFAEHYTKVYHGKDKERKEVVTGNTDSTNNNRMWSRKWNEVYRSHALESIEKSKKIVLPFSCKKRLNIDFYDSSFGAVLRAGFFPLTLRINKRAPNEGTIRKYFGGKSPPAMTIQNLWIELMKRVLSNRTKQDRLRDRLGRKGHDEDQSKLLWECLNDQTIQTCILDVERVQHYNDGVRIPLLTLKGESISKSEGCWTWHDKKDWENNKGKLPIVSMNTSTTEIKDIFDAKENANLPGLVVSIDHWCIEGDDNEVYEPSPLDLHEHYDIRPDRFHEDEPTNGARTFATFVKRIIDTSKYSIARADVRHTRRAYGVLLRSDFE